nr:tyrosine--tRNA ligase [Pseudomonadota bacterium]
ITRFHSSEAAKQAQQNFINRFAKNKVPDEMPEFSFDAGIKIANLLKDAGLVNSTSDAFRMIKEGAAKIEGEKIDDRNLVPEAGTAVYQVGKRKFARVTIQ